MSSLPLLIAPNPLLRKVCTRVNPFDITHDLIKSYTTTMRLSNGIGLAAPQVGTPIQFCVVDIGQIIPLINPSVLEQSSEMQTDWESCLSIPGISISISTPKYLLVSAHTLLPGMTKPTSIVLPVHGMYARIVAHELDHLRGVLITDYLISNGRYFF